mgnify:CR=1 FL=1
MPPSATWRPTKYALPRPPNLQGKPLLMPIAEVFVLFCLSHARVVDF